MEIPLIIHLFIAFDFHLEDRQPKCPGILINFWSRNYLPINVTVFTTIRVRKAIIKTLLSVYTETENYIKWCHTFAGTIALQNMTAIEYWDRTSAKTNQRE